MLDVHQMLVQWRHVITIDLDSAAIVQERISEMITGAEDQCVRVVDTAAIRQDEFTGLEALDPARLRETRRPERHHAVTNIYRYNCVRIILYIIVIL